MYIDNLLTFSSAQALTSGSIASTNVIDLLGVGSGNASQNIIGNVSVFGEDVGIGDEPGKPKLLVIVGTALTGGTSINFQFQGAPDNGSNSPGTYVTYAESGAVVTANLLAGEMVFNVDVPAVLPFGIGVNGSLTILPRFLRMQYVISGTYSAGTISAYILRDRMAWMAGKYPSNFVVA